MKGLTYALEKDILLGEVKQYKAHRQVLYSLFVLGYFLKGRSLARLYLNDRMQGHLFTSHSTRLLAVVLASFFKIFK